MTSYDGLNREVRKIVNALPEYVADLSPLEDLPLNREERARVDALYSQYGGDSLAVFLRRLPNSDFQWINGLVGKYEGEPEPDYGELLTAFLSIDESRIPTSHPEEYTGEPFMYRTAYRAARQTVLWHIQIGTVTSEDADIARKWLSVIQ